MLQSHFLSFRLIPARAGKTAGWTSNASPIAAHPRAGGENFLYPGHGDGRVGSSPRGRGKRRLRRGRAQRHRLIPARAGKTSPGMRLWGAASAHPRAGGENYQYALNPGSSSGSSPRGRGKHALRTPADACFRLIPARAGKTLFIYLFIIIIQAHPRAGGENMGGWPFGAVFDGSSPRGRGKPMRAAWKRRRVGLIPARAGKTRTVQMTAFVSAAHPRAGGENEQFGGEHVEPFGSSPRGRGKREDIAEYFAKTRLIPARAGKTVQLIGELAEDEAHPRAGGENQSRSRAPPTYSGSSPRGRGKPAKPGFTSPRTGLIPARAGKTAIDGPLGSASKAHPRAGGENWSSSAMRAGEMGSSPRGRGKHFLTCAFIERIGQILETLELAVSSGSYSVWVACATDAPQDQVRSIGLVLPSSRGAS